MVECSKAKSKRSRVQCASSRARSFRLQGACPDFQGIRRWNWTIFSRGSLTPWISLIILYKECNYDTDIIIRANLFISSKTLTRQKSYYEISRVWPAENFRKRLKIQKFSGSENLSLRWFQPRVRALQSNRCNNYWQISSIYSRSERSLWSVESGQRYCSNSPEYFHRAI